MGVQRAAASGPHPSISKLVSERIASIQKLSRTQAEAAFAAKEGEEAAADARPPSPLTEHEKKKIMRNKSAFISRRRTKNYTRLLEGLVRESEAERDRELAACARLADELRRLRGQERTLMEWLSPPIASAGVTSAGLMSAGMQSLRQPAGMSPFSAGGSVELLVAHGAIGGSQSLAAAGALRSLREMQPVMGAEMRTDLRQELHSELTRALQSDFRHDGQQELRSDLRQDIRPGLRQSLQPDLRPEVRPELPPDMRPSMRGYHRPEQGRLPGSAGPSRRFDGSGPSGSGAGDALSDILDDAMNEKPLL